MEQSLLICLIFHYSFMTSIKIVNYEINDKISIDLKKNIICWLSALCLIIYTTGIINGSIIITFNLIICKLILKLLSKEQIKKIYNYKELAPNLYIITGIILFIKNL